MTASKLMIWVTFDVIGFHYYPDAPTEVKYLSHHHRHVFKFKVIVEVSKDNREIEFHTFKKVLQDIYPQAEDHNFGAASCEHIANDLLNMLAAIKQYGSFPDGKPRQICVEVSEDGENGGYAVRLI